jgi:perosamine synthetase
MRIMRTLPPAAAPLGWRDLGRGVGGALAPGRALRARAVEIRRQFGVRHAFLVSSGTAALTLALEALKSLSPRREVVLPAYTCFSVPAAVVAAGLRPVPCDVDPETFDFDHGHLARAVGPETLCVLAHHLYGIPTDVPRVRALAHARGAFVVEDAAQAMDVARGRDALGTLGDVGVFSLGRGKNLTCGSGGVVVTRSDVIGERLLGQWSGLAAPSLAEVAAQLVRLVALALLTRPRLFWIPAGLPFLRLGETVYPRRIERKRLSGLQAGVLSGWRDRLARANRVRSDNAAALAARVGLRPLTGRTPYLRLPLYVTSAAERDRVLAASRRRGLGLAAGYPAPVSEIAEIAHVMPGRDYPAARRASELLLTAPTHHSLTAADREAIAACVGRLGVAVPEPSRRAS